MGFVENVNIVAQGLSTEVVNTVISINDVLPVIQDVYSSLDSIETVITYKESIDAVVENIDKISIVADDLKELVSEIEVVGADLQSAQSAVETIALDLSSAQSSIAIIIDNLEDIIVVAPNVDSINMVAEHIVSVNAVSSIISSILVTSDSSEAIRSVALNILSVNSIDSNMADILAVSENMASVCEVSSSLEVINSVSIGLPAISIVADNIEDVTSISSISSQVAIVGDNITDISTVADNIDALLESGNSTAFIELELIGTLGQVNFGFNYTDPNAIEMFYNGRLLSQTDWYLSNGDTLTLSMPVDATGDILTVRTWNRFNITDAITDEDLQEALFNMYSKSEIDAKTSILQASIDASTSALLSLATAQGQITNATTPVFSSIPKFPLKGILDFTTIIDSTYASVFEFDAVNSVFRLYQATTYTFLSTIEIKSNVSAARTVTFYLVDNTTNEIILTQTQNILLASGNTESYPMSTLLTVSEPLDVRVEVTCSDTGYELRGFSSILMSAANVSLDSIVGTISDFEGAFI